MKTEQVLNRIQIFLERRLKEEGTINKMMDMKLVEYDMDRKTVVLSFTVEKWQLNPVNHMHGGMICTALDITLGCTSYIFSEASFTPTVNLSVNFNKSVKEHDILLIKGVCDHVGSRLAQVRAIASVEGNDDVVASASGTYAINKNN